MTFTRRNALQALGLAAGAAAAANLGSSPAAQAAGTDPELQAEL